MISALRRHLNATWIAQSVWQLFRNFVGGGVSLGFVGLAWSVLGHFVKMREKQRGFCGRLFHPLRKEFQRDKFSLTHLPVDDFVKSQWQRHTHSLLWLVYRWALALCFSGGVLGSMVQQFAAGKWFIYLTDWGFFLCMYTSIFGAVLVSVYHFNPDKFIAGSWVLKLYWASHWSTLVIATLITFIYWLFIYPVDAASATALYNLWAHGFNSVLMLLDHMLVAFPTRLLHFVYPFSLGLAYGIFSLVYYLAGGVDTLGNRYIYEILDWSQPGWAVGTIFGCILIVFVFCLLLFALYKLRCWIYRKRNNSVLSLNAIPAPQRLGFFQSLAQEFRCDKFGLEHFPVEDFVKSQWQRHTHSLLWLVYRWALALFFSVGVFGSWVQKFNCGKWFIQLTNWGFFLCMYTNVFGAVLVSVYFFHPDKFMAGSWVFKLYWVSHWSTLVLSTVITFIYWLFIYTGDIVTSTVYNIWSHCFNSILMLLDHMLVAFPTRLLHSVYPMTLGLIYGVFSIIYYLAAGTNLQGCIYIYKILDWTQPARALITTGGSMLLMLVFSLLLFGLYQLRSSIYRKRKIN